MENNHVDHPSPRSTSVSVPGLDDCYLSGGDKTTSEVGTNPPPWSKDSEFDISVSNLPENLGFSADFQAELEAVGGNLQSLVLKLLNSHNLDDKSQFKAGQLCSTPEQLDFYTKKLDAGPMVTCWLTTGYEIPFTQVPTKPLFARNNQSGTNISFC